MFWGLGVLPFSFFSVCFPRFFIGLGLIFAGLASVYFSSSSSAAISASDSTSSGPQTRYAGASRAVPPRRRRGR
ncbi:hypothetical protein B0H14DRAFT_2916993 [Mycena olivaceomarginata]|nr:hypothetical protein B0H14DRAFT_2916993 [Mycena olivaceomarginata]